MTQRREEEEKKAVKSLSWEYVIKQRSFYLVNVWHIWNQTLVKNLPRQYCSKPTTKKQKKTRKNPMNS